MMHTSSNSTLIDERLNMLDENDRDALLGGVTPQMLDWWFSHMERDTYLAFHPVDHEDFAWLRGTEPDRHVGATHLTHQRYGGVGPLMRAEISFIAPEELLDTATFAEHHVGAAICAIVHVRGEDGHARPEVAWLTTRRLQHVHEEFGYLEAFLPGIFEQRHPALAG